MRHYEIVFLIHPDQKEQIHTMIDRYKEIVTSQKGTVHRIENWGKRRLAYMINDVYKAHYIMLNVECSIKVLREIERNFQFNDAVIRNLVIKREQAITNESSFMKDKTTDDKIQVQSSSQDKHGERENVSILKTDTTVNRTDSSK